GASGVSIKDLNGDGIKDIVSAAAVDGTINVLFGNSDGTFKANISYNGLALPTTFGSVKLADLNGDGITDAVGTDAVGGNLDVFIGNSDGSFKAASAYSGYTGQGTPALIDMNGDGNLDILSASYGSGAVSLLIGNGNGSFKAPVSTDTGAVTYQVIAAD